MPTVAAEALLAEIQASGLRGRGGGWFPTAQKMQVVIRNAAQHRQQTVVICNAMEGEPAGSGDKRLTRNRPHLVLDGVELAAKVVGARRAYVAIHENAPQLPVLREALAQRPASAVTITASPVPARYVASEESALAHFLSGGPALPVFGMQPYAHGVHGHPTLVNNAETLASVALIARYGSTWYRGLGVPDAPGTTLVSVGGCVGEPQAVEVATGTPVRQILEQAGGLTGDVLGFRTGGFGGTWTGPDLQDETWDPDALRSRGIAVGSGILWALPGQRCGIVEAATTLDYLAGESAGQCGVCTFGLSATAQDMLALADLRADAALVDRLRTRLAAIPRRGGCALPDGGVRMAQSALTVFSDELAEHLAGRCSARGAQGYPEGQWTPMPPTRPHPIIAQGRRFQ